MADNNTIARFLSSNSSMPSSIGYSSVSGVDSKSKYRPDKIFIRDDCMKWDLIYNDIDTPYRLVPGTMVYITDRASLKAELKDLMDFKI